LDIIRNSLTDIENALRALEKAAEKVDLTIKTKEREGLTFEKVEEFKYLGATFNIKND